MHTVIIGLGVTGLSCLRHLYDTDELVVIDTRAAPPNADEVATRYPDAEYRFGTCQFDFLQTDRVVVSPGISLEMPLVRAAMAAGLPVVSDIDLFCQEVTAPVVAVTGTNGKSTVTSLVGHMLERLGKKPGVGGNLGDAALDVIAADRDCYAIELSSFQLERMQSCRFQTATILNVSEDHIDRHGSLQRYAAQKQRIYAGVHRAVANRDDALTAPKDDVEHLVTFGADAPAPAQWGVRTDGGRYLALGSANVIAADELPLVGRHNEQNVLAAFAMLYRERQEEPIGVATADELAEAVHGFKGLAHRCERIRRWHEIDFVNDSKATNVGATLAALEGLGAKGKSIVLIAGGDGKGADFAPLRRAVASCVRHLVLLGIDAPALQAAVGDVPVSHVQNLDEAVVAACDAAEAHDTVLLSPACASLDMFDSYVQRGEVFRHAVLGLGP